MLRLAVSRKERIPTAERQTLLQLLAERSRLLSEPPDLRPFFDYAVWCSGNRFTVRSNLSEPPNGSGIRVHTFRAHSWAEAVELFKLSLAYIGIDS